MDIECFFFSFLTNYSQRGWRNSFLHVHSKILVKKCHWKICFFSKLSGKISAYGCQILAPVFKGAGETFEKNILSGKRVSLHDFWALGKKRSAGVLVSSASCQICILRVKQNLSKSFFQTKLLFSWFLDIEQKVCGCLSNPFR